MMMSPMQQKLIESLLQHNNLLITQKERVTNEFLTLSGEKSCKDRKEDVAKTENDAIRHEEMSGKPGMSETSKHFLEGISSRVIQQVETKNCYRTLETEENSTDNVTTESLNKKITAKQTAINAANQNKQNSKDETESNTPGKGKLLVTVVLGNSVVKDSV